MPEERLQKILSAAGAASRRAAERLMLEGRVTVNGVTQLQLGAKADVTRDDIRVDGSRIRPERLRYILLNKPTRVITTREDPQGRRTVMDLLRGVRESVYPVGRLDFDSGGLLLLTNDGDLAARLMHPRHGIEKRYRVEIEGVPTRDILDWLERGVELDGRMTAPAQVRLVASPAIVRRTSTSTLEIVIREGRNRQVRRMCEAVGHPVSRLSRVAIGPLRDARLPAGAWRDLTSDEVEALQREAHREAPMVDTPARQPRRPVERGADRRGTPSAEFDEAVESRPRRPRRSSAVSATASSSRTRRSPTRR